MTVRQASQKPSPWPTYAIMAAHELAERRAERGLPPTRLQWRVSDALARSRGRLEEAARNIDHVRATPATAQRIEAMPV